MERAYPAGEGHGVTADPEHEGHGAAADPGGEDRPAAEDPVDHAGPGGGDGSTRDARPGHTGGGVHPDDPGRFGRPGRPLRRSPFLVGFTFGLGVLLAYAGFLALRNAASLLVLVFIALFLAIGLHPAVARLRSWGLPRGAAVALVALTVVLLLCGGVVALVPPLVSQSAQFLDHLPHYLDELRRNETINDLAERYHLAERLSSAANAETAGRALGGVLGGARLIFGTLFGLLTVLVLTIYFLAAFDQIRHLGYALVPASRRERVQLIGDEILDKVGAYMVGALSIAVLAGGSAFVFAMVVGLAYPFALAVVVAVCDLIPQIGATIGAVIVSLVGFASSWRVGLACVVFFVVYQQIENYLIYPMVMRRSVKVNDVSAIVAALLGVALLGVVGALVAIPAVAALQLIVREVVLPRQQAR
ncbi:AI-2E family transporter [Plantactinospora sp. KBS50]|uniref:AI-2E family transporter n=1 Tax=Plantactinospora sp. KBS50 TaxID=2024580 RepID=UPI000BAAE218|nr:AI-2E family transporter [Plantactinospora sp. KBS50]ASW56419.1 AI-2E family transporter [Plantactinospora sp. KBS50]